MAQISSPRTSNRTWIAYAAAAAILAVLSAFVFVETKATTLPKPAAIRQLVVAPAAAPRTLDLGAGYTLKDGQIIAPVTIIKIAPMASQTLDLGAGYTLKGGQIVAPVTIVKPAPMTSQTLDLGAGYTLKDGQIFAPVTIVKPVPAEKVDLKGGYWLIDGKVTH